VLYTIVRTHQNLKENSFDLRGLLLQHVLWQHVPLNLTTPCTSILLHNFIRKSFHCWVLILLLWPILLRNAVEHWREIHSVQQVPCNTKSIVFAYISISKWRSIELLCVRALIRITLCHLYQSLPTGNMSRTSVSMNKKRNLSSGLEYESYRISKGSFCNAVSSLRCSAVLIISYCRYNFSDEH
jgi:hypothetical protein